MLKKRRQRIIIAKKIPIPPRNKGWTELARKMKKGDSVQFSKKHDATSLAYALRDIGARSRLRTIGNKYRVWRAS